MSNQVTTEQQFVPEQDERFDFRRLSQFLIDQTMPEERQSFIEVQESMLDNEASLIAGQDSHVVKSILQKLI